jgi:hypothetical protein
MGGAMAREQPNPMASQSAGVGWWRVAAAPKAHCVAPGTGGTPAVRKYHSRSPTDSGYGRPGRGRRHTNDSSWTPSHLDLTAAH